MPTDGIVLKELVHGHGERPVVKVKPSDLADCEVVAVSEGTGKHSGRLGALTVATPEGGRVQVGTGFTDYERAWIWARRHELQGEVARVAFHVRAGDRTNTGPRFDSWHPDKSEVALRMYAEGMDPSDPKAWSTASSQQLAGDAVDEHAGKKLFFFEGRNTAVVARTAADAIARKQRGGERIVAVLEPSDADMERIRTDKWVMTRRDGLPPGKSKYGHGPGYGPRRHNG